MPKLQDFFLYVCLFLSLFFFFFFILQCVRLRFRVLQNTGVQTKWGLACVGAVSLKMNHSSCNDDFWLYLEGYARAYYRVLHAIYGLPQIVAGKKSSLCMLTRHFNQGFSTVYLDRIRHYSVAGFYKCKQKVNSICT